MMTTAFRPVNNPLSAADPAAAGDEIAASPMTPRSTTAPTEATRSLDDAKTPTRATFNASALATQKPLPTSPFPESVQLSQNTPQRTHSQHSRTSKESDDVDMDDSDGEGHGPDDGAGSDGESVYADGTKKKKKSQRFYCTDYPPCNLSFTRSEHLARHIRKHTGERPFQCHCSRRFSRLDNLRQHAQTVHVNEDIPIDSLAATGTRFQRQIRTDRVRQPGRARASTAGSVGPAGRGHSKSLSTSSIGSVSSIASAYSVNEARRRPPPLIMAESRSRLPLDSYRGVDMPYYRPPSPSDFSTPTSATFSTGQNSPRWGPVMSPGQSHSRSHSMYAGSRTPGRRLSVPSGGNPFQSPHGPGIRGPVFGPPGINSSNGGAFSPSPSSLLASPTTSTSAWSRRESMSSAADEAWRRRTWHPDTRDFNGASRLSQVITPSQFPPDTVTLSNAPPTQQQSQLRLPGIESFDEIAPLTPPQRNPSPMMVDSEPTHAPPPIPAREMHPADDGRDAASHWGLSRLHVNTPPRDSAGTWASEANQALQARAEQTRVRFEPDPEVKALPPQGLQVAHHPPPPHHHPMTHMDSRPPPPSVLGPRHQHTVSAPAFTIEREAKRRGWYNGPVATHQQQLAGETIHEGRPHVDRIVHPNISHFQGFPAREQPPPPPAQQQQQQQHQMQMQQQQQQQQQQHQPVIHQLQQHGPGGMERMERIPERPQDQGGNRDSLKRLEALVAVATSEGSAAAAY